MRLRGLDAAGFPRRIACDGPRLAASLVATPRRMPVGESTAPPPAAPAAPARPADRPAPAAPVGRAAPAAPVARPAVTARSTGAAAPPGDAGPTRRGALSRLIAALRGG
ncbi:MAG: hypothetical protein R2749_20605 [Acidimicrobiales bacterium]